MPHVDVRSSSEFAHEVVGHARRDVVAPDQHRHPPREPGEVHGRLTCAVAPADHVHDGTHEGRRLGGGRTVEHATADQRFECRDSQSSVGDAAGDDHGPCGHGRAVGQLHPVPAAVRARPQRRRRSHEGEPGAERPCLLERPRGELPAAEPVREARIVADPGTRPGLPTHGLLLHEQRAQPLRGGVDRRREARGTRTHHDHVELLRRIEVRRAPERCGELEIGRVLEHHRRLREADHHHGKSRRRPAESAQEPAPLVGTGVVEPGRHPVAGEGVPQPGRPLRPALTDDPDHLDATRLSGGPLLERLRERAVHLLVADPVLGVDREVDHPRALGVVDRLRGGEVTPRHRECAPGAGVQRPGEVGEPYPVLVPGPQRHDDEGDVDTLLAQPAQVGLELLVGSREEAPVLRAVPGCEAARETTPRLGLPRDEHDGRRGSIGRPDGVLTHGVTVRGERWPRRPLGERPGAGPGPPRAPGVRTRRPGAPSPPRPRGRRGPGRARTRTRRRSCTPAGAHDPP